MALEKEKTCINEGDNLLKCPHCQCCFCSQEDLKRHIARYGSSKNEHAEEFRKVHERLEHGSLSGPE